MLLPSSSNSQKHRWSFFRTGGFDQVRLTTGADLIALDQLDQKLWVALSCPTQGVEFNEKTLKMIDQDGDGRIRVPDIIEAVKWAGSLLKNPDDLTLTSSALPLAAINDESPVGKDILRSAREILANLGQSEATVITTDDMADTEATFSQARFNGDGIIPADAADDLQVAAVINDIVACLGADRDRSGKEGICQERADQFFADLQAYLAWHREAETDQNILSLGERTEAAVAAFEAVKQKIDDYFARCRLAAFDERSICALNRNEADYIAFADHLLPLEATEARDFPLALIAAGKSLPLGKGLNPAWLAPMSVFADIVVIPLLGSKTEIAEPDWDCIRQKFAAYAAWQGRKAGRFVETLGLERIREIDQERSRAAISDLIARDCALKDAFENISSVDRLVHYHRYLFTLLNNFVSFSEFYTRKSRAIFQAGTLFLDGRSCELCVYVSDVEKHAALATLSGTYIAYCQCTRRGGTEKMFVAAAFTGGDSDFLMVGRNGVFYDSKGQDWDATIIKTIDHPISVRQAFWSPYKRLGKMVREQAMKFAASREKSVTDKSAANIAAAGQEVETAKPAPQPAPPAPPFDVGKFAGIFAAIGLALGAIGTAIASVLTGFLNLQWWQMPLVIAGVMLLVSGPSMLIAWLKLRQRSLGPLLDANGWAVNARARINVAFGESLTKIASLPVGTVRSVEDPFADKKSPWPKVVLLVILLAICVYLLDRAGKVHEWTGGLIGTNPAVHETISAPAPPAMNVPAK